MDAGDGFGHLVGKGPGQVDAFLVGHVDPALQKRHQENHGRVYGQRQGGQPGVEPEKIAGKGHQGQQVDHRDGQRHAHEIGGQRQLGNDRRNHHAGLGVAEEIERQGNDVGKQAFTHARQGALADDDLDRVDDVFEQAGRDHGYEINGAVVNQQVDVAQADGFVDDALLHLQRQDAGEYGNGDKHQQQKLQLGVGPKNPGEERTLDYRVIGLGHAGNSSGARAGPVGYPSGR